MEFFKNIIIKIFDLNEILRSLYNSIYSWIICFIYFFTFIILSIIKDNNENIWVTVFWTLLLSSLIERILIAIIRYFFFDYKVNRV